MFLSLPDRNVWKTWPGTWNDVGEHACRSPPGSLNGGAPLPRHAAPPMAVIRDGDRILRRGLGRDVSVGSRASSGYEVGPARRRPFKRILRAYD